MPVLSTFSSASKYGFFNPAPPLPITPGATVYLDAATPTSYPGSGRTIIDVTGNGNNGTIIGNGTYSQQAGGSWFLDGKSGFIRIGPVANSGISNVSWTMGIWVSPNTQVGNILAMAAQEPSDGWQMPPLVVDQQRFVGYVWTNSMAQSTAYTIGNWFYITLVWDAINFQSRFYINGSLIQSVGNASYSSSGVSNYLNLGKNIEQAAVNRGWFRGYISNFHFYGGTALSDSQVLFNYNALSSRHTGSTLSGVNTTNLGLYLDTNRIPSANGSTTWTDLSGNSLNMTGPTASQLTIKPIGSQVGNFQDGGLISPGGLTSNGGSGGGYWQTAVTGLLNTDTHTVAMWTKLNSTTAWPNSWNGTWEKFFSYNANSDRSPSAWRFPNERIFHFRYAPSNGDADMTVNAMWGNGGGIFWPMDAWFYCTWVKNGATVTGYVNGVSVGTRTVDNPKTAGTAAIGLFESYFGGSMQIDGLMVYNRSLSASEVLQNYNAQRGRYIPSPNNYRLVFEINANDPASYPGTGTSVFETSGRQLTGTMTNVTYNGNAIDWTGNNVGGYWSFNGSSSGIAFPNDTIHNVDGNGVTAEVWMRPAVVNQNGFLIEKGVVNSQYSLFLAGTNLLIWRTVTSGNGLSDIQVNAPSFINTTEWHHIVGTYSSGLKKLYVNGVLISTQTNITGTINQNSEGMSLGRHGTPNSYWYNGQIGEARVYNRQLSDAQVLYNYNTTKWRYAKTSLPAKPTVNIYDSTNFQTLRNYLAARLGNYKNPGFYEYTLDAPDTSISDGGGDMFDGGNFTNILQSGGTQISNVGYNTNNATVASLRYTGLGYSTPLTLMATGANNTALSFGFSKSGNMGADGGGSVTASSPYDNTVVNGFTVIARMKIIYNAGDPSIGDLYFAVSHPSLGSSGMTLTNWTWATNTNDGQSQFEVTGTNILQFCTLLSRPGGAFISDGDAQTVINAYLTDIKAALGI